MKYENLNGEIYKDNEITISLEKEGRKFNLDRGKSKFSDRECICFEFKIKHTDDLKKRLTRKWLDVMMKKEEVHNALYNTVFNYIDDQNVEIEASYDWEWCWQEYYSTISGNKLVVVVSYTNENELNNIREIFKNDKRWCF